MRTFVLLMSSLLVVGPALSVDRAAEGDYVVTEAGRPGVATRQAAGDFVYFPGIIGNRPGTDELAPGVDAQVHQALDNLGAALQAEGLDFSHVVRANVFLSDTRNFGTMNAVYRTYFAEDPPTRATVQADLATPGALVELSMVAARADVPRRVIVPQGMTTPDLPYSWGIQAGRTLFVAGATSRDPSSYEPVTGDIATQTERVLQNIGLVLRSAGMDYSDVVACNVFLDDARDFRAMNETYRTFFPESPPARATVRARLMNPIFRSEIQCTAVEDRTRRVVSARPLRPGASLSPAIQVGDELYLSGMLGRGPDGYAPGDPAAQTRQTLENISATLALADMSFSNVIHVTTFVADIRHASAVSQVIQEMMPDAAPPSVLVGASLVSTSGLVEIMMTARR